MPFLYYPSQCTYTYKYGLAVLQWTRKNPDAGIDCSHLHGTSFIDGFVRVASTKEKTIGAAIGAIGGLVSGMK